jgi:ribonuclease BN (tRNA processing enzyme)
MELTIVGCSGSYPGPDSAASCYLVEADGFRLLIDLGNGALGSLQRYARLDQIDAVCLSHLHADHCLDMCGYQVFRTYYPSGQLPPIPVYGPAGSSARLDRAVSVESASSMASLFDFVTLVPGTIGIGPFTVTVDHMNHPVEILTHLVPWNDAEDALAQAASAYPGQVSLARTGSKVKVGS